MARIEKRIFFVISAPICMIYKINQAVYTEQGLHQSILLSEKDIYQGQDKPTQEWGSTLNVDI